MEPFCSTEITDDPSKVNLLEERKKGKVRIAKVQSGAQGSIGQSSTDGERFSEST
jgi:hypothetical protein